MHFGSILHWELELIRDTLNELTVEEGKNLPHHFCLTTPVNFNWLISPSQPVIGQTPVPVRFNWPRYGCCQDALLYPCDFVRTGTEDTEEVVSLFASRDRSWTVVGSGTEWHWRGRKWHRGVCYSGEFTHTAIVIAMRSNICRIFLFHHQHGTWSARHPTSISPFILEHKTRSRAPVERQQRQAGFSGPLKSRLGSLFPQTQCWCSGFKITFFKTNLVFYTLSFTIVLIANLNLVSILVYTEKNTYSGIHILVNLGLVNKTLTVVLLISSWTLFSILSLWNFLHCVLIPRNANGWLLLYWNSSFINARLHYRFIKAFLLLMIEINSIALMRCLLDRVLGPRSLFRKKTTTRLWEHSCNILRKKS